MILLSKIPLYCVYYAHDDPKKNTALALSRFGLAKILKDLKQAPKRCVILDPFASKILEKSDFETLDQGIIIIDCSWNRIFEVFPNGGFPNGRKLPDLQAGNSINYAKFGKLSTAEAYAGALMIAGAKEQAELVMSKFRWGHTFFDLNQERLGNF
jgi:pre-rRNA-processing protein TSR3